MSDKKFLKGKKILFTSFSYASFGGAELNPVELAEQLQEFGAKPYFFSYDASGPLAKYIENKFHTKVITDSIDQLAVIDRELNNTQLDISNYDYIWVGANVIPISIVKQINKAKKLPKFIFIHMSQLPAFPLDAPLLAELEKKIASRILSISEKTTTNCVYRILGDGTDVEYYRNPTPGGFKLIRPRSGVLKTVAVISSSYPTDEIMQIGSELEEQGVKVEYIGKFIDNVKVVDAQFYDKYDLIVGIGKNVQYSLVSGVPVYVYGRFGGPGYLTDDNYDKARDQNFSGRGFDKKNAKLITKEIILNYKNALSFHNKHRNEFIQEFSLDVVAERLFKELETEDTKQLKFADEYINWLVSMQILSMQRLQAAADIRGVHQHIADLESAVKSSHASIDSLNEELASFNGIKRSTRLLVGNVKRKMIRTIHGSTKNTRV